MLYRHDIGFLPLIVDMQRVRGLMMIIVVVIIKYYYKYMYSPLSLQLVCFFSLSFSPFSNFPCYGLCEALKQALRGTQ